MSAPQNIDTLYKDTKANVEAITSVKEGWTAYATDIDAFGVYNGITWDWIYANSITTGWITPAGSTQEYSSADAPTFVLTVSNYPSGTFSAGMRTKLIQTTTKYFIITAVADVNSTTVNLTLYGGTDYTLANSPVSGFAYSTDKAPYGFPLDPDKWSVVIKDTSDRVKTSPTNATWTHTMDSGTLPEITIPIGCWKVELESVISATKSSATTCNAFITLSTANNSESDNEFTGVATTGGASGTLITSTNVHIHKILNLASKTLYYVNMKTTVTVSSFTAFGSIHPITVRAICAYL